MAKVRLTDKYVAAVSAASGSRLEVFDQHPQGAGLMLRVTDAGKKTWMVRYRTDDGVQRRFSLGLYPDLSLSDARAKASEARGQARDGHDPAGAKRRKRAEARAQPIKTYDDLSDAYFVASENGEWKPRGRKKAASTVAGERWLWTKHIKPHLGSLRVEDVSKPAIKKVLRDLVAKGHDTTSNKVRSQIRQMFNFAISEGRVAINPVTGIDELGEETPRDRVLRDEELRQVWAALDDPADLRISPEDGEDEGGGERVYVSRAVAICLKLLPHTMTRRHEVSGMEVNELDLKQMTWTIPAARTKNRQTHLVPLTASAIELINEALALAASNWDEPTSFVFPSPTKRNRPITPAALTHAMRDVRKALGMPRTTPHDLRRTASSNMASERLKVSPFIIGRLLNHTSEQGGAAKVTLTTYALHDFASEKRAALTAWEGLLNEILGIGDRPDNVQPMRGGAK